MDQINRELLISSEIPDIATSLQARFVRGFVLSNPLSWFIFGLGLVTGYGVLAILLKSGFKLLLSISLLFTAIVFYGNVFIYCSRALKDFQLVLPNFINLPDSSDVGRWFQEQLGAILNSKWMGFLGSAVAVGIVSTVAYVTEWYSFPHSWFGNNIYLKLYLTIVLGIVSFCMGAHVWLLFATALFVRRLGKIKIVKVSIYQHPSTSVKAIGTLFFKFSFSALGIYILWILAVLSSPLKEEVGYAILGWIIVMGILLVAYFVFPQYEIHKIMSELKHEKMRSFSKYLESSLESAIESPTSENVTRLKELFELQKHLDGMDDWPFNIQQILSILGAIIIPILLVILKILFD